MATRSVTKVSPGSPATRMPAVTGGAFGWDRCTRLFSMLKTDLAPLVITGAMTLLVGACTSDDASTTAPVSDTAVLAAWNTAISDTAGPAQMPAVSWVGTGAAASGTATTGDSRGDAITPPKSICRTHNPPGDGPATACRTWYDQDDGYHYGSWNWSGTSDVYVQGWFDGHVYNLAHNGSYSGVKKFLTRGCKHGYGCSTWS
jgi:hypothetical protein